MQGRDLISASIIAVDKSLDHARGHCGTKNIAFLDSSLKT